MRGITARQALSDALRYWEPRRIFYNGALVLVVATVYVTHLAASRSNLTFDAFEGLFVLAVQCVELAARLCAFTHGQAFSTRLQTNVG